LITWRPLIVRRMAIIPVIMHPLISSILPLLALVVMVQCHGLVLTQIITALQNMVTRRFLDRFSHSYYCAKIAGGSAYNVIPADTQLMGTIRSFSEDSRKKTHEEITKVATNMAISSNCTATVKITHGYPVTINNDHVTKLARQTITKLFGAEGFVEVPPITAAEDFSYVLQKFPGTFVTLGATVGDPTKAASLHSAKAEFDEQTMVKGIMMHCAMAFEMLSSQFSAKL